MAVVTTAVAEFTTMLIMARALVATVLTTTTSTTSTMTIIIHTVISVALMVIPFVWSIKIAP